MERQAWASHYKKLTLAYNKPMNQEQMGVYYEALHTYSGMLVGEAVDALIKDRQHWPPVADVRDKITSILASKTYEPATCAMCEGNGFAASAPQEHFNLKYEYVKRCPLCRPATSQRGAA
jgi:hypothetical protein